MIYCVSATDYTAIPIDDISAIVTATSSRVDLKFFRDLKLLFDIWQVRNVI